jgi:hypothetical protein
MGQNLIDDSRIGCDFARRKFRLAINPNHSQIHGTAPPTDSAR